MGFHHKTEVNISLCCRKVKLFNFKSAVFCTYRVSDIYSTVPNSLRIQLSFPEKDKKLGVWHPLHRILVQAGSPGRDELPWVKMENV
jgi:hypothetical protein